MNASSAREHMLERFAVVTSRPLLQRIAEGQYRAHDGAVARKNRDAPGSCTIRDGVAELRLPPKDLLSIVERHASDRHAELCAMGERSARGSIVITGSDPQVFRHLAEWLIDTAALVHVSQAEPIKGANTDHDTQQVLLRASQAFVLADELENPPGAGSEGSR